MTALVALIVLEMILLGLMTAFAAPWLVTIPVVLGTIAIGWLILSAISPRPTAERLRPGHEDDSEITGPGRD